MLSTDREEFGVQLRLLCAGLNVPLGDREEAYWKGLSKMSLLEFARVVEFALGETGPDKIPTTKQCWQIRNDLRRVPPPQQKALAIPKPPEQYTIWRLRVDGLFFRYLAKRRLVDSFQGDIALAERRAACRRYWEFLDEHQAEFGCVPDDWRERFVALMDRIPDDSADITWLAAELHRQKLEDQAGTRQ